MQLKSEIVDKIFSECEWPMRDFIGKKLNLDEAPDVAKMVIPLPNGCNAIAFHPDKLIENKEKISLLLDQVINLDYDIPINFFDLNKTKDGIVWTSNIYEMQKLYLLGIVTDQIAYSLIENSPTIKRINEDEAVVNMAVSNGDGVIKILKKDKKTFC